MRGGRVRAGRVGRSAMERCSFFNVGVIRRCYRLFAAFNIADGTVISQVHSRHRATEFRGFLTVIDKAAPAGLVVHLVCGSYVIHNTAEIKTWLARRPASTFSSRRPTRRG